MLQQLLAAGADVNAADAEGETALHQRASRQRVGVVRALIAAGADPTARDKRGETPLHAAICPYWGVSDTTPGVVRELLAAGADVNQQMTRATHPCTGLCLFAVTGVDKQSLVTVAASHCSAAAGAW